MRSTWMNRWVGCSCWQAQAVLAGAFELGPVDSGGSRHRANPTTPTLFAPSATQPRTASSRVAGLATEMHCRRYACLHEAARCWGEVGTAWQRAVVAGNAVGSRHNVCCTKELLGSQAAQAARRHQTPDSAEVGPPDVRWRRHWRRSTLRTRSRPPRPAESRRSPPCAGPRQRSPPLAHHPSGAGPARCLEGRRWRRTWWASGYAGYRAVIAAVCAADR